MHVMAAWQSCLNALSDMHQLLVGHQQSSIAISVRSYCRHAYLAQVGCNIPVAEVCTGLHRLVQELGERFLVGGAGHALLSITMPRALASHLGSQRVSKNDIIQSYLKIA